MDGGTVKLVFNFKKFLDKKFDVIILFVLFLAVLLTRIPFMSHSLYTLDSFNYALAFQNFNIYLSQPQPPGYIFFVALGKIINIFFNNPNTSMIFISILFSILTVFLVYFLAKQMFSREIAVVASVLLIFNPIFWFYGEIAMIYTSEALFATLIAYFSYQVLRGDNRIIYISAIILGLSGGFRQDLIIFMFPLWLFCLIYQDFDFKKVLEAFIVLIASVMLWFIPTILLSGGLMKYLLVTNSQLGGSMQSTSLFFGANLISQLTMDSNLLLWTISGIGIFSIFILLIFICFNLKRVFNSSILKNSKTIFLILWIIPAFLFYLLLFIQLPGYTMVYLPVFALVVGYVIINLSMDLNKKFKKIPNRYFSVLAVLLCVLFGATQFISTPAGQTDYGEIKAADIHTQYLNQSLMEFNPENTVVLFGSLTDWRNCMYYYPSYETYLILYNSKRTVHLNSSDNNIIWMINPDNQFFHELKSKIEVKTMLLPNGYVLYYSPIENNTNFTIDNLTFIKD